MKYFNWAQIILGIWLVISPWILGFGEINTALWNNVVIGILILISGLWCVFGCKTPPQK